MQRASSFRAAMAEQEGWPLPDVDVVLLPVDSLVKPGFVGPCGAIEPVHVDLRLVNDD